MNHKNSIFRKVKSSAIQKMALFLSNNITRSCSIGIAGETASGKSTIALDIINTIQSFAEEYCIENAITRINTDDYYYDRSDMVKKAGSFAEFAKHYDLDVPEALELELMKKHIKYTSSIYVKNILSSFNKEDFFKIIPNDFAQITSYIKEFRLLNHPQPDPAAFNKFMEVK